MSGSKRDRLYLSSPRSKRRRPVPDLAGDSTATAKQTSPVIVTGLPADCAVLELKSRFELYGAICRLHIDRDLGFGHVTFRSKDSAEAAVAAAADPSTGIIVRSKMVQVSWPDDPLPQWTAGVKTSSKKDHQPSSKLIRAELPLSRHGRSNKKLLGSTGVSPTTTRNESDVPFKGREIIAYDDII